jgi:glucose/mannose-6-phosphate isomerase
MKQINHKQIKDIDKSNMYQVLLNFPDQVIEALEIGKQSPAMNSTSDFVILGMGGSAIGGDILANYVSHQAGLSHIRIIVNRDYDIPAFINNKTAVIASSYSGGTEETIFALESAAKKTDNILCLTTGGRLGELADQNAYPKVIIPGGLMPRCALGYSYFSLLKILLKSVPVESDILAAVNADIEDAVRILKIKSRIYSKPEENNPAFQIARSIANTIPVLYSSNRLSAINLRWRAQFQENAKNMAFGNVLPEMNHNEINSWSNPGESLKDFSVIFMKEKEDNWRIIKRFEAVETILSEKAANIINTEISEGGYLARMFDLIYLGDWVSYFLAILNREDPTPIPLISELKALI